MDEVKLFYTRMINRWVTDEKDRLTVFDRNGPLDKNQKTEKETLASRLSRLQKQNEKIHLDINKASKNRETR